MNLMELHAAAFERHSTLLHEAGLARLAQQAPRVPAVKLTFPRFPKSTPATHGTPCPTC